MLLYDGLLYSRNYGCRVQRRARGMCFRITFEKLRETLETCSKRGGWARCFMGGGVGLFWGCEAGGS